MSSNWPEQQLRELITIKHGFAFQGDYFKDRGPYVLLSPGNFWDEGGFKSTAKQKFYDGPVPEGYILSEGDLLVAMTEQAEGLLGSAALIPSGGPYLHNQRLGLVETDRANKQFLYYLFNSRSVRQQIRMSASGAKVRHTSPTRIGEVKVRVPPLETQRRIADILSAYDDLIDVNQRRIAILEEMARRLFEEWFVRFRYPGHEGQPTADVVPDGWSASALGSILALQYGKALKADERSPGPVAVFGSSGVVGTHDTALVPGPGIVVGRKGNVGSVHWSQGDFYPIDTVFFVDTKWPLRFIQQLLLRQRFLNSDAAVPGLNRNQALAIKAVLPPRELAESYERTVAPQLGLVQNLTDQNDRLRAARDLLLPKLIAGEIEVSAAPAPNDIARDAA